MFRHAFAACVQAFLAPGKPLRSGIWTSEEAAYADHLIDMFRVRRDVMPTELVSLRRFLHTDDRFILSHCR